MEKQHSANINRSASKRVRFVDDNEPGDNEEDRLLDEAVETLRRTASLRKDGELVRRSASGRDVIAEALQSAARLGDSTAVRALLARHDADANARDRADRTALMLAAECGDQEAVRALLAAGATANVKADDNWRVVAGRGQRAAVVPSSVESKVAVDAGLGSPLMCAATRGHVGIIAALLGANAMVDARTRDGRTALQCAVAAGQESAVRALVDAGADRTRRQPTLTQAARHGRAGMVPLLVSLGWAVDGAPGDVIPPLVVAAERGHVDVVRALVDAGANVEARTRLGMTALMRAAMADAVDVVQALVAAGADVEGRDGSGDTAMMYAAQGGADAAVRALTTAGADVCARSDDGSTPFMYAVQSARLSTCHVLADAGAEPDARNHAGHSALVSAVRARQYAALPTLAAVAADMDVRWCASVRDMKDVNASFAAALVRAGVRVSSASSDQHMAAAAALYKFAVRRGVRPPSRLLLWRSRGFDDVVQLEPRVLRRVPADGDSSHLDRATRADARDGVEWAQIAAHAGGVNAAWAGVRAVAALSWRTGAGSHRGSVPPRARLVDAVFESSVARVER